MKAHRLETVLTEDGTLTLGDLPFQQGDEVEVIILARSPQHPNSHLESFYSTVICNVEPTPLVPLEDWEAVQ